MSKFIVVGCGKQGSVIARFLLEQGHDVMGVDKVSPNIAGMLYAPMDLVSAPWELTDIVRFANPDAVVCAMPSAIAEDVQIALAETGNRIVDISFNVPNYSFLKQVCARNGTLFIPDCGLAPNQHA